MAEVQKDRQTFRSQLEGLRIEEQREFTFDNPRLMVSAKENAYAYARTYGITFSIKADYKTSTLTITRMA